MKKEVEYADKSKKQKKKSSKEPPEMSVLTPKL